MFRRRAEAAPAVLDADEAPEVSDQPAKQAGKGRPTPKRSEVERRRRQPYTAPPANKKAAAAQTRERRRTEQRRKMDAMRRGEEWALPAKDRGAVRGGLQAGSFRRLHYIALFALSLRGFWLGAAKNSSAILYIEVGIVGLIGIESLVHATIVRRLASRRFPGESTRGLVWYIAKRSIRLRSSRIPPARVARGAAI